MTDQTSSPSSFLVVFQFSPKASRRVTIQIRQKSGPKRNFLLRASVVMIFWLYWQFEPESLQLGAWATQPFLNLQFATRVEWNYTICAIDRNGRGLKQSWALRWKRRWFWREIRTKSTPTFDWQFSESGFWAPWLELRLRANYFLKL